MDDFFCDNMTQPMRGIYSIYCATD